MSDRIMGTLFISIMTILVGTTVTFAYFMSGGLIPAILMFAFCYLFTGLFIWIACLPDSGYRREFFYLVFFWYLAIIWIAIVKNGE